MISIKKALLAVMITLLVSLSFAGTTGRLAGRVRDESAKGLGFTNVFIYKDTLKIAGTQSKENGAYILINLPPGIYSVHYSHDDYDDLVADSVVVSIDRITTINATMNKQNGVKKTIRREFERVEVYKDPLTPWEIDDSKEVDKSDNASPTGKLAGIVTDESGKGIPYVSVLVFRDRRRITGVMTRENGRFIIINLPPGTYDVKFVLLGYGELTVTGVLIKADQTTTLNATLLKKVIERSHIKINDLISPDIKNATDVKTEP
jgi:hypothetical protein